jgi:hypothetical protein
MAERHKGNLNPKLAKAVETRSRGSFAAASGNQCVRAADAIYD